MIKTIPEKQTEMALTKILAKKILANQILETHQMEILERMKGINQILEILPGVTSERTKETNQMQKSQIKIMAITNQILHPHQARQK